MLPQDLLDDNIPYVEKFWSGKKLANLANRRPFTNFLSTNVFLGSVLVIHAAHSPIFYPPIDSDQCIRQCFTPPKFSHVRYIKMKTLLLLRSLSCSRALVELQCFSIITLQLNQTFLAINLPAIAMNVYSLLQGVNKQRNLSVNRQA